ncbi:hypothetical protein [Mucilaginibacter sp.]|uniref:hypothetical protein n=1 Tax=Mucilaginibacter sp. TaxID=1882438 RepID=UPI00285135D0|nr:hypothetical protein [Mucilaginibacter sp.]MDR3697765.1 hypothetical protein [Mucilaginibacter sp.]
MSTIELKEKLMEKINGIDDEALLHEIADFIDFDVESDGIYVLSPEEVEAIKDGIDQIERGMAISNEEARKIFDKCLGK